MSVGDHGCLLWGPGYPVASVKEGDDGSVTVRDSDRAGGSYVVSADAIEGVKSLSDAEKARLTFRLVKARQQGTKLPIVDLSLVANVRATEPTPKLERAVGIMEFLNTSSDRIGQFVDLESNESGALAWSDSTIYREVDFLVQHLRDQDWVEWDPFDGHIRLSMSGYSYLEDLLPRAKFSQVFVAMWFDPSMNDVYTEGIEVAIQNAGYEPLRIDRVEHINKIDDEIIKEIRRSRFVVADFTCGDDGARGSVYYEAGFAEGLGIPVIRTCKEDQIEALPFDTRQYAHIPWTTSAELRIGLENRIWAVFGEGPNAGGHLAQELESVGRVGA